MRQLSTRILRIFLLLFVFQPFVLLGQQGMSLPEYIATYKHIAISEMRETGIPASIKMAQAILESGFGNSELAVNANNHFGIKCHGWPGKTYTYTDDEPDECFRKYDHPMQSFYDHSEFLVYRPRYAFLFDYDVMDYEAWAYGLSRAGYATNPRYPEMLLRLIREHDLARLDRKAMDASYVIADHENNNRMTKRPGTQLAGRGDFADVSFRSRQTGTYNRIRYVVARQGDTPRILEREFDVRARRILRYNDLEPGEEIRAGDRIYLQPKRRKGEERHHIARAGDTMHSISHDYGIRIENLYRRNDMTYGMEPRPGQKILLRGWEGSMFEYLFRRP